MTRWNATPTTLRRPAPIASRRRRPYVIRTGRDLADAIDAYTALRVNLIAEIAYTAAHPNPAFAEVDRTRLAEARAQLDRIHGALGMLTARRTQ